MWRGWFYTSLEFIGLLLPTENTGLSPEGVCSMFRTVGKVVNNLGFSDEVSTPVMYVISRHVKGMQ